MLRARVSRNCVSISPMASGVPKVLVTGASGYVANHIIKQLLEGGKHAVRGTVRNLQNDKKVEPVRNLVPSSAIPIELVEADLLKEETWPAAVEGCQYVIHVASPVPAPGKFGDEQAELIDPAVNGTRNVLKACSEAGVKRVVLTSSVVAISVGLFGAKNHPKGVPYTDKDWSPEEEVSLYNKSKTLAERAAWDYVEQLPEDKKFELVVMNPGYVMGPLLSTACGEVSSGVLSFILKANYPGYPSFNFPIVDVRDVAAAHIRGLEVPEAAGKRFILVSHNIWMNDMAKLLKAEFASQGYKISTGTLPNPLVWMGKLVSAGIKYLYPMLDVFLEYDTEPMHTTLGIQPLSCEQTVLDHAYSMIELGIVPRKPHYRGPGGTGAVKKPSSEPAVTEENLGGQEEGGDDAKTEPEDQHTVGSSVAEETPQEGAIKTEPEDSSTVAEEPTQEEGVDRTKPEEQGEVDKTDQENL